MRALYEYMLLHTYRSISALEEVFTLPILPRETGQQWRAQERLAVSTLGVHVVTADSEYWFTILSRVLEKGPAYPMACLKLILDTLEAELRDVKVAHLWSDGPSQFKNRFIIGTFGYEFLGSRSWDRAHLDYGAPKHFKGAIDAHFRVLSGLRKSCVAKSLVQIQHVVELYKSHLDDPARLSSAKQCVIDDMPPAKSECKLTPFARETCLGIAHSFS